jgi:hypothetical protein
VQGAQPGDARSAFQTLSRARAHTRARARTQDSLDCERPRLSDLKIVDMTVKPRLRAEVLAASMHSLHCCIRLRMMTPSETAWLARSRSTVA